MDDSVLKELWNDLTFKGMRRPFDVEDVVIAGILWVVVLTLSVAVVASIVWVIYTIYRLIAYDYETVALSAKVTRKEYEPERTGYVFNAAIKAPTRKTYAAEHKVYFITKNGLKDMIDNASLYHWATKGAKFKVKMEIGRDQSPNRKIRYWKVLDFYWY